MPWPAEAPAGMTAQAANAAIAMLAELLTHLVSDLGGG